MTGPDAALRTLAGRAAIVTGAASGMGAATARLFAQDGARVALIDRDAAGAEAVAAAIVAQGGAARAWACDVADHAEVARTCAAAIADLGGLDVLVNNAGVNRFVSVDDDAFADEWDRSLAINLTAQQAMVRAALPALRRSSAARIVNIASTEALGATPRNAPYAAAKAGVIGLTRALAVELGPEGITANCVCPGPIDTAMTGFASAEDKATFARRRTALRRYGSAEEVAHVTWSLCLPGASYVTGAVIAVDGGLTARNA